MNKLALTILFLIIPICSVNSWNKKAHYEMTKAAAKFVFNLDNSKACSVNVHVSYDMKVEFLQHILAAIGGSLSPAAARVGEFFDKMIWNDKYPVVWDSTFIGTQAENMDSAGFFPDVFDAPTGLFGPAECMLGHLYVPNGIGFADYMVEYFYNLAVDSFKKDQNLAFIYLGFASHYLADVGIAVHAESDWRNLKVLQWQYKYHNFTEGWVDDNWDRYQSTVDSASQVAMPICNIGAAVRSLALETYSDVAEWNSAWGAKGGKSYLEMFGISEADNEQKENESTQTEKEDPQNITRFDEIVKKEIWRTLPRIVGLFVKFKEKVGI